MKKTIFCAILGCLFVFNTYAQDEPESTSTTEETSSNENYGKWMAHLRVIAVAPEPYNSINGNVVDYSTTYAPQVDIAYFLSKNFAVEMMLTTSKHDVEIVEGIEKGSVSLMPITMNMQYHFYLGKFKPYFATGMYYAMFYGEDSGGLESIDFKDVPGHLIQAGLDYNLNDKWFINIDLKKYFLKTEITPNNDNSSTFDVNVDPFMAGIGVGMRF